MSIGGADVVDYLQITNPAVSYLQAAFNKKEAIK